MKKLFDIDLGRLAIIASLLFFLASCQQYDNSTHGTTITPGKFVPTYDSTGAIIGTHQSQDTSYLLDPTWRQAWTWAGERGNRWLFWLGIAILVVGVLLFIKFNNPGSAGPGSVIPLMIAIVVAGGIIGGSLEWEKTGMQQEIRSTQYDSLMHYPGNLGPFWDSIRVK